MSSILHLSDLHLGEPAPGQLIGSHRSSIADGDQRAQKDVLSETLEALEDMEVCNDVDAVVVSGDLTNGASPNGFAEFDKLLANLRARVGPENVLVVPGNHDVPKDHGPYLATPLLDGIDFEASGRLRGEAENNPHIIETEHAVIIPINSSHFCWGRESLSEETLKALDAIPDPDVRESVEHLRSHDVARVSNGQLNALPRYLSKHNLKPRRMKDRRVRIAVLHHQLLPVGTREEMKAFESLTNLGAVRALLSELEIDLVLNGHKHEGAAYWDYVHSGQDLDASPHRMLVLASPGEFLPDRTVARVLQIGGRKSARDIVLHDVIAPAHPGSDVLLEPMIARLWQTSQASTPADGMIVKGASVSEVYARLRSLFDPRPAGAPLRDLMCEILDASDAGTVPEDYPDPDGIEDVQRWMTDLVKWWQKDDSRLLDFTTFNHGERLYRRWGDQAKYAAGALMSTSGASKDTTRALIVLVDPVKDTVGATADVEPEFPSFVLVQLQIVHRGNGVCLDCTGYFRKQEMRYWWPVNVAELAVVQQKVLANLPEGVGVSMGRLRTITAYAKAEERLPAVAVPAIDRALDQDPRELWELAYGLVRPSRAKTDRTRLRARWEQQLAELDPAGVDTGRRPRISYRGIEEVARYVSWLGADGEPVGRAVTRLAGLYGDLANADPRRMQEMSKTIEQHLAELREALDGVLGHASTR